MPEEDDLSDGPVPATPAPPPLSDAEAAAVMVMLLGEDQAGRILAQLDPIELQLLGEKMCALGDISPESIIHSITGFVERTEKLGIRADGRVDRVHSMMRNALGDVKAENMMARILPDQPR